MAEWTSGYITDLGYTYGYYKEINPLQIKLSFLNSRLLPPTISTACELGFGQGISINIHAASSAVHWIGTDFNPSQAFFAQELAHASGSGARLFDDSFAEFCARSDLPEFDFIGLHGVWSWISDDNRAVIVEFLRRKLRVGGVVYISSNTQPGWASFSPVRHLITQHAALMGASGSGIIKKIADSMMFVDRLMATQPLYSKSNATVPGRLRSLKAHQWEYLAHEYFNTDWRPMYFSETANMLAAAKLKFACSANMLDHVDALNLSSEQQGLLQEISDAQFRETVRDFIVNQQFRKDYWVKGYRRISESERVELLRALRFVLITHRSDVSLKINGSLGEASMSEAVYGPILDAMAEHQVYTLGQLEEFIADNNISFDKMLQAIVVLVGAGHLALVQDEESIATARGKANALNASLLAKARTGSEVSFLASPVTGGGIMINRINQLFLLARLHGRESPHDWTKFAWDIVAGQGQRLVKDSKILETAEASLEELTAQAEVFLRKHLPVFSALKIEN